MASLIQVIWLLILTKIQYGTFALTSSMSIEEGNYLMMVPANHAANNIEDHAANNMADEEISLANQAANNRGAGTALELAGPSDSAGYVDLDAYRTAITAECQNEESDSELDALLCNYCDFLEENDFLLENPSVGADKKEFQYSQIPTVSC